MRGGWKGRAYTTGLTMARHAWPWPWPWLGVSCAGSNLVQTSTYRAQQVLEGFFFRLSAVVRELICLGHEGGPLAASAIRKGGRLSRGPRQATFLARGRQCQYQCHFQRQCQRQCQCQCVWALRVSMSSRRPLAPRLPHRGGNGAGLLQTQA